MEMDKTMMDVVVPCYYIEVKYAKEPTYQNFKFSAFNRNSMVIIDGNNCYKSTKVFSYPE